MKHRLPRVGITVQNDAIPSFGVAQVFREALRDENEVSNDRFVSGR